MKNRSRIEIFKVMLEACVDRDYGVNKQRIMYGSDLSFAQFRDYMDTILNKGLLEQKIIDGKLQRYFITDLGKELLATLTRLQELLGNGS